MKTIRLIAFLLLGTLFYSCDDVLEYVDPFVGTAYTGHTYPNAAYPFGFVQPGPQTGNFGWEYCSGYNNDDSVVWGFSQNRLNGTGIPDLGDLLIMPFSGTSGENFRSRHNKQTEIATPGYYSVELLDNKVLAEMTCTPHVAMHKYSFKGKARELFIDFQSAQTSTQEQYDNRVINAEIKFVDPYTITGFHHVKGWVERHIYYVIKFDAPVIGKDKIEGNSANKAPKYVLEFDDGSKPLNIKIALSTVSIDGAIANLEEELPDWNFERVRKAAEDKWREYLKKAIVSGENEVKRNYYTAMYHLLLQPSNIADVDGRYRGADDKVRTSATGKYYSTFSLWDTYRAAHPFYTLLLPIEESDMVNSMIEHSYANGFLPIWTLWGKENYCMIGNHAVPVVVDACLRNLPGIDKHKAYYAVRTSLTENHYRSDWDIYDKYGYFPFDQVGHESVSRTLECGYDDYCAGLLAENLGYKTDAELFNKRSGYYKNLFDKSSGLVRGKDSKGNWRTPFDKFHLSHGGTSGGDYTEGNAWQYVWHVPQDVKGLVDLMGGEKAFVEKLDSLFILEDRSEVTGFVGDVTGLIGQYAHGNEPSHHIAYLYSLAGRNDRTAEIVREIMDKFYESKPDGLCGNDDCGQMSAWYMFSAMGFYPVNPVAGEYVLGAPQIPEVILNLSNGKTFKIKAENLSEENKYVKAVYLNGIQLGPVISYDQIMEGGKLEFVMASSKNIE